MAKPSLKATHAQQSRALYRAIMPSLAGGTMLGASLFPWLIDPLGKTFTAWQVPIDIGWQVRSNLFSYGLLCLCCALYAFFIAYLVWQEENRKGEIGGQGRLGTRQGLVRTGLAPIRLSEIGILGKETDPRRDRGFARHSDPSLHKKPLSAPATHADLCSRQKICSRHFARGERCADRGFSWG